MTTKASRKKRVPKPPFVISGSRVLYYSLIGRSIIFRGHGLIIIGGRDLGRVPRLDIAEPLRERGFEVLHCDKHWNGLAHSGGYHSIADAKRRAERMYPGITATWVKYSVSKRKALAIERTQWRGEECSFCGRIPPDFQNLHWALARKVTICNICVNEIYRDFLESQEVDSARSPRGDYYAENGFDHIVSYISRLLVPKNSYKYLQIFALDQRRGCGVIVHGKLVQVSFIIKVRPENPQEASIRSFFVSRSIRPSRDYLDNNGSFRILQYPINGPVKKLTTMIKTILHRLCDISPKEGLTIRYGERKDNS